MLNERRDEMAEGPEPERKHNAETGATREEKENKGRKVVVEKKQEVKSNMLIEGTLKGLAWHCTSEVGVCGRARVSADRLSGKMDESLEATNFLRRSGAGIRSVLATQINNTQIPPK
jgi:hypothetical protein